MSLTDKLARVVGTGDADQPDAYECKDCGARFTLDRQRCPDCDGCVIDRIDWDDALSE